MCFTFSATKPFIIPLKKLDIIYSFARNYNSFSNSFFLNLHGNMKRKETPPEGSGNDNVFDIMQGVVISLMTKLSRRTNAEIRYFDAWGTREEKYRLLDQSTGCIEGSISLNPAHDRFFLVAKDFLGADEYEAWPSLKNVFPLHSLGIETSRDDFAIAFEKSTIVERVTDLCSSVSDEPIRERYGLDDKRDWSLPEARRKLRKMADFLPLIRPVQYRPFDERFVCYSDAIVTWPRHEVLDNLLQKNLALICIRNSREESTSNFYCTRHIVDKAVISSRDNATIFPLHRQELSYSVSLFDCSESNGSPNLSQDFVNVMAVTLGEPVGGNILPANISPEEIFQYIYSVFHSPAYRTRYAEFLKIDFPRIPLTGSLELFQELSKLGGELVSLHLLESPKINQFITQFTGEDDNCIPQKPTYKDGAVWINANQRFENVPEAVWYFHVGGYQVCEKWLKDRKGRRLSEDDIAHYQKIVVALNETIHLMQEIDAVIALHGGWPTAFQPADS
jgi:predicted helicase